MKTFWFGLGRYQSSDNSFDSLQQGQIGYTIMLETYSWFIISKKAVGSRKLNIKMSGKFSSLMLVPGSSATAISSF